LINEHKDDPLKKIIDDLIKKEDVTKANDI
jgi:hypothetical protein